MGPKGPGSLHLLRGPKEPEQGGVPSGWQHPVRCGDTVPVAAGIAAAALGAGSRGPGPGSVCSPIQQWSPSSARSLAWDAAAAKQSLGHQWPGGARALSSRSCGDRSSQVLSAWQDRFKGDGNAEHRDSELEPRACTPGRQERGVHTLAEGVGAGPWRLSAQREPSRSNCRPMREGARCANAASTLCQRKRSPRPVGIRARTRP